MHVGVSFSGQPPAVGGGFTFVRSILSGLDAAPGSHRWTLIGHTPERPHDAPKTSLDYLSTHRTAFRRRLDSLSDAADRLRYASRHLRAFEQTPRQRRFVDAALRDYGIEVLWSLTPEPLSTELPFFTTVWDLQHRLQPWFPEVSAGGAWRDRERMYAAVLPRAAGIIVGTERGAQEVRDFYRIPAERISVVPFPVPALPASDPASDITIRTLHGCGDGYILYPAQFWAHKNHVNLLHALARLRARGKVVRLVCTGGDGGNLEHVKRVARELSLSDSVDFLGFVPAAHLAALYRGAACLCFPSFFGPDNLPPLEAMSHGCAVVAADVPGAAEQLADAAELFDPAAPDSMANALQKVLDDPALRSRLRANGLARAATLTPGSYVTRIAEAFTRFETRRHCWPATF